MLFLLTESYTYFCILSNLYLQLYPVIISLYHTVKHRESYYP